MWKCPVCDKENETLLCGCCCFDGSRDYEALPTFCELGSEVIPSKTAKKKQRQLRDRNLLKCGSCGSHGFAFDFEQMVLRCLQCGEELTWDDNPGVPKSKPKGNKEHTNVGKQAPPPIQPRNTGFANANEMLVALGLQKAERLQQEMPKREGKAVNDGFSSAREMLEALGIKLDDSENR